MKNIDLKSVLIGIMATIIIFMSIGASPQDEIIDNINVRTITVFSDNNDLIGKIGWFAGNNAVLLMHPSSDNTIALSNGADGYGLAVSNSNSNGYSLYIGNNESEKTPHIKLGGTKGNPLLFLGPSSGGSILTLSHSSNKTRFDLTHQGFMQTNRYGNSVILAAADENDNGLISILNKYGDLKWSK